MNYFRKIIYLCKYNGGECRGNIGFVKLSKKQTRFKIEISLSGDWSLKGEKVYLLDKDKNAVNKVFFGTITEEGNEISITKQTSEAGMLKGELAGVLIGGEGYVVCAGTDDDLVRVEDYVKTEEREKDKEAGGIRGEKGKENAAGKIREEREKGEATVEAEGKMVERVHKVPEAVEKGRPRETEGGREEKGKENAEGDMQEEREKVDAAEVGDSKDVVTEEIGREREKASEAEKVVQGEEIPEEEEMIEVEIEEEHDQAYIFRKLFTAKPNMYPFEDDEMEKCVQIAPGDFSDFPKEYWQMGSNTFLLQGYYNYRHLILARDKEKVYVGIPGQYHRRDKYMADMFGFGRFKSILRKKERLGDFGYWMKEIEVETSSSEAVCVNG